MKKVIFISISIILSISAKTQITNFDSVNIINGITEKGIYLSRDEFIHNSPSIKSEFLIKERSFLAQAFFYAKPNILKIYVDSLDKYKRVKTDCWGLFDGEELYLVKNKKCYEVEIFGQYSKYKIQGWRIVFVGVGLYSIPFPMEYEYVSIIDFDTDNRYNHGIAGFKKLLLAENETLYNKFIDEKRRGDKIDVYLKMLNDNPK